MGKIGTRPKPEKHAVLQERDAPPGPASWIFLLKTLKQEREQLPEWTGDGAAVTQYRLHTGLPPRWPQLLLRAFFISNSWHTQMKSCGPILAKPAPVAACGSRALKPGAVQPETRCVCKRTPGSGVSTKKNVKYLNIINTGYM